MARVGSLTSVYSAIAHLRGEGRAVTVASVSKVSGVARSTFYQDTDDWNSVLRVIDGGDIPSNAVVEIASLNSWRKPSLIRTLEKRVCDLENELKETTLFADETYQRLIDQLQYYFAMAHETPHRRDEVRRQRIELTRAYEEITRLKREMMQLVDESRPSNIYSVKGRKRHISIPRELSIAKAVDYFLTEIHRHIPDKAVGKTFTWRSQI